MKKFLYLSAAAVATLFATSCSSDDVPAPVDGDMTTFQIKLPEELATRFGDGSNAKQLNVAIYKKGTTTLLFSNFADNLVNKGSLNIQEVTDGVENPTWTVSVPLVKGQEYDIVFWAQNASATAYTFSATDQAISVNYTGMDNFDDARDAFFSQLSGFKSEGKGDTVTLTRPFAQVNIGTSDYDDYLKAAGLTAPDATAPVFGMSVSGVANSLNLLTGAVESNPAAGETTVTATSGTAVKNPTLMPVNGADYSYLGMVYVLAGAQKEQPVVNVTLQVNDDTAFASYPNVPIQMNYRTNIFGNLLTNTEVFNVTIDPDFIYPDINDPQAKGVIFDATNYPGLYMNASTKRVSCDTPAGFHSMVKFIIAQTRGNFAAGYGYYIDADIDLQDVDLSDLISPSHGARWVDTGSADNDGIVFDGRGHTLSNLTMTDGALFSGALGGSSPNATPTVFRNMTFDNATVSGAFHVGVILGQTSTSVICENIKITNSHISGTCNVGAIIGRTGEFSTTPAPTVTFRNCSVSNTTVTANGGNGADPTGASSFMGCVLNVASKQSHIVFEGVNTVTGNTFSQGGLLGGGIYGYATYDSGWKDTGVCDTFTNR